MAQHQGFTPFIDIAYQGLGDGLVEDAAGCSILAGPYVVSEPEELLVCGGTATSALCFDGESGSVSGITISGGTEPYTYEWTDGSTTLENSELAACGCSWFLVPGSSFLVGRCAAISR